MNTMAGCGLRGVAACGLMLSAAILWRIFTSSNNRERFAHSIFLVAVIGISALFGLAENDTIEIGIGVVQRLLYVSGFAWLIYQEHLLEKINPKGLQDL